MLLVGKYAQTAVDSLFEGLRRGSRPGEAAELPRIPNGSAGRGYTHYVDFHTTKSIRPGGQVPSERHGGGYREMGAERGLRAGHPSKRRALG